MAPRMKYTRRKRTTTIRKRKTPIRRKYTRKRTYRRKSPLSNTTLRTVCEIQRPLEYFNAYTKGTAHQTRMCVHYNNVVDNQVLDNEDPHNQNFDITKTERWDEYSGRYRQIIIHGCSIKYTTYMIKSNMEYRDQNYATFETANPAPQLPFHDSSDALNKYSKENMRQRPDYQCRKAQ